MNLEKSPGSLDIGTSAGIMGSSPEQEMTAQSSIDMSKFLQFDVDLRYVSALPGQTALPGQYVGAYTTADARLGWQVSRQFELSFVDETCSNRITRSSTPTLLPMAMCSWSVSGEVPM
jgi:outer membrane receptor for monomeric catechols